jgi:ADP-ribose pyrophosphatase YjhB (NUDIX family)
MINEKQIYKVFYNNRCLIITDSINLISPKSGDDYLEFVCEKSFSKKINEFENKKTLGDLYIYTKESAKKLFELYSSNFIYVAAAGGVVRNEKLQILFIYRFNKWDLPKGHVEEDEEFDKAAYREVVEETGVKNLTLTKKIASTFHVYMLNGKRCMKETHWYEMNCFDSAKLCPQTSEAIEKAKWVYISELNPILIKTYPSIKDLIKNYLRMS